MCTRIMKIKNGWVTGFFLCLILACSGAFATSVKQLDLEELLNGSELVFDGVVIDIDTNSSRPAPGSRPMIFTRVTFRINEIIKGAYKNSTIQLSFLGGSESGKSLVIEEMLLPKLGEQGIYFVERVERKQVHPLHGWSQGHFLVVTDPGGIKRVMTFDRRSVAGVESSREKPVGKLSKGVVKGLKLKSSDALSSAMRVDDFKRMLVEMQREAE